MSNIENPFQPHFAVDPRRFVGRNEEVRRGKSVIKAIATGNTGAILITGRQSMGKSSLANYLCFLEEHSKASQLPIDHLKIQVSDCNTSEQIANTILNSLSQKTEDEGFFKGKLLSAAKVAAKGLLNKFSQKHEVDININVKNSTSDKLVTFPEMKKVLDLYIRAMIEDEDNMYQGLILVLDNVNGVVEEEKFARNIKGMVEDFADEKMPFCLVFSLTEERWKMMNKQFNAVSRVFNKAPLVLGKLSNGDVRKFYQKRFDESGIEIDDDLITQLIEYSGGIPVDMQMIGHEVFDFTKKGKGKKEIDEEVIKEGVKNAAIKQALRIEEHSDETLQEQIISILSPGRMKVAVSELWYDTLVKRSDLKDEGSTDSQINSLIKEMTKAEIISTESSGQYRFKSPLVQIAFLQEVLNKHKTMSKQGNLKHLFK